MRPCDCNSLLDVSKLQETGIKYNDESLNTKGHYVEIKIPNANIKISAHVFKRFAKWFLEDQTTKNDN